MHTGTGIHIQGHAGIEAYTQRHRDIHLHTETAIQTNKLSYRQTETNRETQADRQSYIHTYIHTYRKTQTHRHIHT